jgi:rhodanese-related sulfurtransferase
LKTPQSFFYRFNVDIRVNNEVLEKNPKKRTVLIKRFIHKSKSICVNCQSGMRSYIACRILKQNGFICYNLAGGYRFFEAVMNEMASG